MKIGLQSALDQFQAFSPGSLAGVRVFFAPGRVNLIGEHVDYNGGRVFPAALRLGTWAIVRLRTDRTFRFSSTAFPKQMTVSADDVRFDPEDDYANYPKGVIWSFQKTGCDGPGFDMLLHGNLPNGAGLSSSASVEMATAIALNTLWGAGRSGTELAQLTQQAENAFVGVNCGIMDQFAVAMGKENHAILLNCDTLQYEWVPIPAGRHQIVIANTNKRRGLADSKYNERRAECEAALETLRKAVPGLPHLAALTLDAWESVRHVVEHPVLHRRARHVVTENIRVNQAAEALEAGDLRRFGQLMNESHVSLRDDYEVTGAELDALTSAAWKVEGCVGSRMTGAGFGGCTVSVVHTDAIASFIREVTDSYTRAIGYEPSFYVSEIGDGARDVTEEVLRK